MDPLAHASVGLIAKTAFPKAPLVALLAATEIPDLLFFAFEAAGVEWQGVTKMDFSRGLTYLNQPHFPWSHGLAMNIVWSLLACGIAFLIYRNRQAGILTGLMVFSHWFLDFLSYNNLPLFWSDFPQIGIGLITSGPGVIIGIIIEAVLILGGIISIVMFRRKATNPKPA